MNVVAQLVVRERPRCVLELGTGQGAGGAEIMTVLPFLSMFTTVNYDYPADQKFGEQLTPWLNDVRLSIVKADTTDPSTYDLLPEDVDLLIIDTHHEAWQAALELELYQYLLVHAALVVVDDLDHGDMRDFWKSLPYRKWWLSSTVGCFQYDERVPYINSFPRGKTPKEKASGT